MLGIPSSAVAAQPLNNIPDPREIPGWMPFIVGRVIPTLAATDIPMYPTRLPKIVAPLHASVEPTPTFDHNRLGFSPGNLRADGMIILVNAKKRNF
jgi:hypothetical protein